MPDLISVPGFYPDMNIKFYHSDPVETPSLSSSLARRLLETTPRKVRTEHPRYAKVEQSDPSRTAEIGTAAHALLTNRSAGIVVIDADDYRTKDAQQARKDAYAAGNAPILRNDLQTAERMHDAAVWCLAMSNINPEEMAGEVVMVWNDKRGCWCRTMLDLVDIEAGLIIDYKTTTQEIGPHNADRYIDNSGYHLQGAFCRRGFQHLRPDLAGRIRFLNLIQDQNAPYDCVLVEHSGEFQHLADNQISAAVGIWSEAQRSGDWYGQPSGIITVHPPGYAEAKWTERALGDRRIQSLPYDPFVEPEASSGKSLEGALIP